MLKCTHLEITVTEKRSDELEKGTSGSSSRRTAASQFEKVDLTSGSSIRSSEASQMKKDDSSVCGEKMFKVPIN